MMIVHKLLAVYRITKSLRGGCMQKRVDVMAVRVWCRHWLLTPFASRTVSARLYLKCIFYVHMFQSIVDITPSKWFFAHRIVSEIWCSIDRKGFSLGTVYFVDRAKVIGMKSGCGDEWSGNRVPVGERFSHPSRLAQGCPPTLLCNGYPVSFPGVKRLERDLYHPRPSSAEVKEKVELYLYSLYGTSWSVLW